MPGLPGRQRRFPQKLAVLLCPLELDSSAVQGKSASPVFRPDPRPARGLEATSILLSNGRVLGEPVNRFLCGRRYYMMVGMVRIMVGGGLVLWWLWMTGNAWLAAGHRRAEAAAQEQARTTRLETVIADDNLDQRGKARAIVECCGVTTFKGMKVERMGSNWELVLGCPARRPGPKHFAECGRLVVPLSKIGIDALVLRCKKQTGSIEFFKLSLEGRQVGDVLSAEEVQSAYASR